MRVPQEVQFAVAEMFWAYMKKVKQMPETRTMLGKLYNDTFRTTLLSNLIERRVNFSSVLFSLRKIGVVKWPRKKDKETIVYNSKGRRTSARKNLAYKINEVNTAITNVAQLVLELREKLVKHR